MKYNVRPDSIDFRDQFYAPSISVTPMSSLFPQYDFKVKHQQQTEACTGFALSSVVEYLQSNSGRELNPEISPYMLYSMARKYDEYPGTSDTGSSLRGALKGWCKYGACAQTLWQDMDMPAAPKDKTLDWLYESASRPLGAYYRIKPRNFRDIHIALNEVGVVYASVFLHSGWWGGELDGAKSSVINKPMDFSKLFEIPFEQDKLGGHAVVLVGYTPEGFIILNSWGEDWGSNGYALLRYEDWLENAMDCWVTQLGVVTAEQSRFANGESVLEETMDKAGFFSNPKQKELQQYIINSENNGALSPRGNYRTSPDDIRHLVDTLIPENRATWGRATSPLDVCLYAHGGLVGENAAAETAFKWFPMLMKRHIFPVFLMWESDAVSTFLDIQRDERSFLGRLLEKWFPLTRDDVDRLNSGRTGFGPDLGKLLAETERYYNTQIEKDPFVSSSGTKMWSQMKQNAEAISLNPESGYRQILTLLAASDQKVRLHLVGHSAGSIIHTHIIDYLSQHCPPNVSLSTVNFLAPAVRLDTFEQKAIPYLNSSGAAFLQLHLTDHDEEADDCMTVYRRSLLYLVSESFENGIPTKILGIKKHFDFSGIGDILRKAQIFDSESGYTTSRTHGGFGNNDRTIETVLDHIDTYRAE